MQDDCIAVALGLPQLHVLEQKELENRFEVTVIYRRSEVSCPRCGEITSKEHDRRQQWKQDRRLRDKVVLLRLLKRWVPPGRRDEIASPNPNKPEPTCFSVSDYCHPNTPGFQLSLEYHTLCHCRA